MILKHLKKQTETLHKKTEEDNLAKYILDHSIDRETYKRLLQQNYLAYARIDALLASNASILTTELKPFADKAKSSALAEDLKRLEGSMMGGLLIRKNLEACTHLEDIEQHHFFGKSAPEVMQRWKAFTQAVESQTYTKEEQQQAVDGAHTAFNIFKDSYSYA